MKTLQQIKDDYAQKQGYISWEEMYQKSFIYPQRVDEVILEAIKEDRYNVAECALINWIDQDDADIDKDSIINAPYPDLK